MADYDGIIIGAGPNGMTVAAYLAKAGLKILLLDKRCELGGGLATEQVTSPGFLHDTHAIYHMMVEYAPPLGDLELDTRYDLKWIYPDLQVVMPFSDGAHLAVYRDPERTCESIRKFSEKDAEAFREFAQWSQEAVDLFLAPASYINPLPPLEQVAKIHGNPIIRRDDEMTGLTPKQIVDDLFENERVRALFLYLATMWGMDYDLEGVGFLVPLFINRGWHLRLCRGGSHHVTHLMAKFFIENGGRILSGQLIKKIIVENGEARGVELKDGSTISAGKFVASSLNPQQTLIDMVGPEHLDDYLLKRIKNWKYTDWSFFNVHMALKERPRLKIAESDPELDDALLYVMGYDSDQDLIDHFDAIKKGQLIDAGFSCSFPSVHDPIRCMNGGAVGLITQEAPYKLENGGAEAWYEIRREHAERCKTRLSRYAANINDDTIIWDYLSTPLDIENKFPNMKQGCFKQGAYTPLQMGFYRPNEVLSEHSTPIKGLYMCGACTHSGGMITYGPGYCATQTIAEDLGIAKWWKEPEIFAPGKAAGLF
ncbi:MAG: NAD(P)/FAD-dependent oxidoreductase [Syntrophaceae bacterium]|nr:NAD(P)/FAD-dependent oxidoreductase [Syntrophaceae bacterium]